MKHSALICQSISTIFFLTRGIECTIKIYYPVFIHEWTKSPHYYQRFSESRKDDTSRLLAESTEKIRSILDHLDNMEDDYFELTLARDFVFSHKSLEQMLGYIKEEMKGMNNRHYMSKETAKIVFEVFNSVYETGKLRKELDWELIRKDGSIIIIETSIELMFYCTAKQEATLMEPEKFSEWRWIPIKDYIAGEYYSAFNPPAREMIINYLLDLK